MSLGDSFTDALSHFVHDGNPGAGAIAWSPYDATADSYLEVETPPTQKAGLRAAECDFWQRAAKL